MPTLRALTDVHDVRLVVTQPDRPAGRSRALTPTPVAALARQHGLETIQPERVDDPSVIDRVKAAGAQSFVVIAYGHKLGPALLGDRFAINLHASLLPKYRGAAPINWAIINGEAETGVSVIRLAQTMDAGDILASAATPIDPRETAGELHDRLSLLGPELVLKVLADFQAGKLRPQAQNPRLVSQAPKLSKADGTVGFDQPATAVRRRIHGLTPWPGCTIRLDGRGLRVMRAEETSAGSASDTGSGVPGSVRADHSVACTPGAVRLLEVQPPGGRAMSFEEYCHGHPLSSNARCEPA